MAYSELVTRRTHHMEIYSDNDDEYTAATLYCSSIKHWSGFYTRTLILQQTDNLLCRCLVNSYQLTLQPSFHAVINYPLCFPPIWNNPRLAISCQQVLFGISGCSYDCSLKNRTFWVFSLSVHYTHVHFHVLLRWKLQLIWFYCVEFLRISLFLIFHILQGRVVTHVRCGGKHNKSIIANFLLNPMVKEFCKW